MTRHSFLFLLAIVMAPLTARAEIAVEPDARNLVASRLEGKWQLDTKLTARLGDMPDKTKQVLSFKSDPTALEKLSPKLRDVIEKQQLRVYLAGYAQFGGKEMPFVLTNFRGNSVILNDSGDAAVTVILAKQKQHDLLFFSEGYEDHEPFLAYTRAVADEEK